MSYPPNKQFYCIIDTETTIKHTVADLGLLIVDRQGNVHNKLSVLVKGHFDKYELFYTHDLGLWAKQNEPKRRQKYVDMLNEGSRMLASVPAINKWIQKAIGQYNPILTAYNLPFDICKSKETGICLDDFRNSFCLWNASIGNVCQTRGYKKFCLDNHLFTNRTDLGNACFKTSAETVASYLYNEMITEPHTAIEDCYIERDILKHVVTRKKWRSKMVPFNWRNMQLKDHYKVK